MRKIITLLVVLIVALPAFGAKIASSPMLILDTQGRPLPGATATIQLCTNANCTTTTAASTYTSLAGTTAFSGTIPSTGILQFYADAGVYYVTVSGSGVLRTFYIDIPTAASSDNILYSALGGSDEGWLRQTAASTITAVKSNLAAGADPAVTDDSGDGYAVGSFWVNTTASPDKFFVASGVSVGAASWLDLSTSSAGITNINGETGAVTLATSTSGTDFNIALTGSGSGTPVFTFQLPNASATARGVVSTGTQTITGAKTFSLKMTDTLGLVVNESGTAGTTADFRVESDNNANAIFVDSTGDVVGIGTGSPEVDAMLTVDGDALIGARINSSTNVGLVVEALAADSIHATTSGTGTGLTATADRARAGYFLRANGSTTTLPMVEVENTGTLDTQSSIFVDNDSKGISLDITRTSATATLPVVQVDIQNGSDAGEGISVNSIAAGMLVELIRDKASATLPAISVSLNSTTDAGDGLSVETLGTGNLLDLLRDNAAASGAGISANLTNTADTGNVLVLNTDGTGKLISGSDDGAETFYVTRTGRVLADGGAVGTPNFSFNDDTNTGLYLIAGSTLGLTVANTEVLRATTTLLTLTGEVKITGVSGDGTGSAVCVKADGNLGTCSDVVDASGNCTCG